jgi:hypothetical protein
MQKDGQKCTTSAVPYKLKVWVDGKNIIAKEVRSGGARGDQPLFVNDKVPMSPGSADIRVDFTPTHKKHESVAHSFQLKQTVVFVEGSRHSITMTQSPATLVVLGPP